MSQQLLLDILPSSPPSLDNFIVGRNQAALHALRTLSPGCALYIWGGAGSGRSHLLQASCRENKGCYIRADDPVHGLKALGDGDAPPGGLVAIDDVDTLPPPGQAGLFALFNQWRIQAGTPAAFALLMSGSRSPRALQIREDLRTRLAWDLVFRLEPLSDDERGQALQEHGRRLGLALAPELVAWLLRHHDRDMRKLVALVDALDRHSLATHRSITLPLLKELLGSRARNQGSHEHDAPDPGPV